MRARIEDEARRPLATLGREHELAARRIDADLAGPAIGQERRVRANKRERQLIVELEAGELAHMAIAIDEPAALAVEHADLLQETLLDRFATLAARGLPDLDRAAHTAALVRAFAMHRRDRAERWPTSGCGGPHVEERKGIGRDARNRRPQADHRLFDMCRIWIAAAGKNEN